MLYDDTNYDMLIRFAQKQSSDSATQYVICWRLIEQKALWPYARYCKDGIYPDSLRRIFDSLRQSSYKDPLMSCNLAWFHTSCDDACELVFKRLLIQEVRR